MKPTCLLAAATIAATIISTGVYACPSDQPICVLYENSSRAGRPEAPSISSNSEIKQMVSRYADKHGVPRHLAHGVIAVESRYNCRAYNRRSRASGIGQVLPATARSVGVHGSLFDCDNGLEATMRYLRQAINIGGAGCGGVSLYERGIYARPVCSGYGRKVMKHARAH